jgi:hypothetical protein
MKLRFFVLLALFISGSEVAQSQHPHSTEQQVEEIRKEQKILINKILPEVDLLLQDIQKLPASRARISSKLKLAEALASNDRSKAGNLFDEVISDFKQEADRLVQTENEDEAKMQVLFQLQTTIHSSLRAFDPNLAKKFAVLCKEFSGLMSDSDLQSFQDGTKPTPDETSSNPESKKENLEELFVKFDQNLAAGRITKEMYGMVAYGGDQDREKMVNRVIKFTEKFISTNTPINQGNITNLMSLLYTVDSLEGEVDTATKSTKAETEKQVQELPANLANHLLSHIIDKWVVKSLQKKEGEDFDAAREFTHQIFFDNPVFDRMLSAPQAEQLGKILLKLSPEMEPQIKLKELRKSGTAQEIYTAALKIKDHNQGEYFSAAVSKAIEEENFELLKEMTRKNGSNPSFDSSSHLTYSMQSLASGNQIPKAIRLLGQIKNKSQRLEGLIKLAEALAENKKITEAVPFLEEGLAIARTLPQNETQARAMISIANSFIEIDPAKSIQIIESLVDQLNEVSQATAVLAKFHNGAEEDNNMPLLQSRNGDFSDLTSLLSRLARRRFTDTNQLLEKFQRTDVKLDLRLSIISGILTPFTGSCGCSTW